MKLTQAQQEKATAMQDRWDAEFDKIESLEMPEEIESTEDIDKLVTGFDVFKDFAAACKREAVLFKLEVLNAPQE